MDYKFYHCYSYREEYELGRTTWDVNSFVSLHKDVIVGEISYRIQRETNSCYDLSIIHFGKENSFVFASDLMQSLRDIFEIFNFNKLNYSVVVGNPMETTYDRITAKYGGRVVGVFEDDVRLIDGRLYPKKIYEVKAHDYFEKNRGCVKLK